MLPLKNIPAVFDGTVLRPDDTLVLEANTRVLFTIQVVESNSHGEVSFLDVAASLNLVGPADWSLTV